MNYLFIAPIPPPVNGQSLAAKTVYDNLIVENKIFLVDTSKQKRERTIKDYLNRLIEIFNILCRINSIYKYHHIDRVYLTLSESTQGNIKDIITFFLLRKVINKSIVHMFGGAGLKKLLLKNSIQSKLTKYYLSMVLKIIVEGQEQRKIFEEYNKQIFIVKNFVEEYLFVSEDDVRSKYDRHIGINILFLSNLIYGKGYKELLDGFINIGTDIRKQYHLIFVGDFRSEEERKEFLKLINGFNNIEYCGRYIGGNEKKELYKKSHIFALPSYYPYEGQPISILEAYSTGCYVITTNHSGIKDIFEDNINGSEVIMKSSRSITELLSYLWNDRGRLVEISINNLRSAREQYRIERFQKDVNRILTDDD